MTLRSSGHGRFPVTDGGEGGRTVNLFIAASPLHYYCSGIIARNFCENEADHLFFSREFIRGIVSPEGWDSVEFLPWPRFHPKEGIFGKIRRTRENLDIVASRCLGATAIRLHVPVIDSEAVNYHINYISRSFPEAVFSVRLIPDGLLNVRRYPLGKWKEAGQYLKKLRRLAYLSMNYYVFRGDRTGSDNPVVDRIYILPGLPNEYPLEKLVELPPLYETSSQSTGKISSVPARALVIGQPVAALGHISSPGLIAVTGGIRELIARNGIDRIDYKTHPRDPRQELKHPDYEELSISEPLENYLMVNPYRLVVGITSTALVTSKLILGDKARVIAYGRNVLERGIDGGKRVDSVFRSLGIELVDHHL